MLLRDNNIDILALNETKIDHIVSDSLISIDGYVHERCDRNRHGGGVLIYIKDTIIYDRLDISKIEVDSLETVTIQIKPKCAKPFVIIAWYRPPKHNINDILNIEKIYKTFDKTHNEIVIMGDSNCDDLPDQDKNSVLTNSGAFTNSTNTNNVSKSLQEPLKGQAHYLTILPPIDRILVIMT